MMYYREYTDDVLVLDPVSFLLLPSMCFLIIPISALLPKPNFPLVYSLLRDS